MTFYFTKLKRITFSKILKFLNNFYKFTSETSYFI